MEAVAKQGWWEVWEDVVTHQQCEGKGKKLNPGPCDVQKRIV